MRFGLAHKNLGCLLAVATPISNIFEVNIVFSSCPVKVDGKDLFADFIPLLVMDFDIILGMDWLSNHYAILDYRNKKVTFHIPGTAEFNFDSIMEVAPIYGITLSL